MTEFDYAKIEARVLAWLEDKPMNIIERVKMVDAEASQYLQDLEDGKVEPLPSGHQFSMFKHLTACFVFSEAPQGEDYWWDVHDSLIKEGLYDEEI